jgi:hypothetical protein
MDGNCVRCGEEVATTTYDYYKQVIGWQESTKHGTKPIFDRVTTGQVMHKACMVRKQHHPGQKEMF